VRLCEGENVDRLLESELEKEQGKDIQATVPLPYDIESSSKAMDKFRDQLAEKMWADYQRYLQSQE
jgi:hypothetical protein